MFNVRTLLPFCGEENELTATKKAAQEVDENARVAKSMQAFSLHNNSQWRMIF